MSRSCISRVVSIPVCLLLAPAMALAASPKVVVTIKPIHALVAGVMAGVGEPELLVQGSSSPHTFALKPSAAGAVHSANIVFRVSEAVEPFTAKLAEAIPASVKLVTLAEAPGVMLLDRRQGGLFEAHVHAGEDHEVHDHDGAADAHHDEPESSGKDGHIWLDPENAKAIVQHAAKVLSEADPADTGAYAANAATVVAKIDGLERDLSTKLAPVAGKPFIVFHDAYQYFEKRFGLAAAGSITVSPDVQPSAKRLNELRARIRELDATCVFAEPAFQPNLIAAVTEGTTAKSGTLDPEGMTLEPGPELYFDLMWRLAQGFKDCLQPAG